MASSTGELKIENSNVQTAPGVELSSEQKTLVGSVLDLFAGRPSLAKLALWKDDAIFADPITEAKGREKYSAQWYGLQAVFSEIERKSHSVTSSGNPITMDMTTRYKIKGIGSETTINSKINIYTEGGKITKVEDKWNGKLPDNVFANVSDAHLSQLLWPLWWARFWVGHAERWGFWLWSFVWETQAWQAFRHLNAVSVPLMVKVPKNAEEDAKLGNQ